MTIIELVSKIAEDVRYRTLTSMIGQSITITGFENIPRETNEFVKQFIDGCSFAGPRKFLLIYQIAKYGFLDLRLSGQSALLDSGTEPGLPLLYEAGIIGKCVLENLDALNDEPPYIDMEQLDAEIAAEETHVCLFLRTKSFIIDWHHIKEIMARLENPSLITFPLVFEVEDACVTNATGVWGERHLYA